MVLGKKLIKSVRIIEEGKIMFWFISCKKFMILM